MYHKIAVLGPEAKVRSHYVSPSRFAAHLNLLRLLRFTPISPHESREASRRSVAITFDDGYENFLTNALPRLTEIGFKSTVFVVADRIGETDTWDEGVEPLMNLDQLKTCLAKGVEIGSHTLTHADLAIANGKVAREEIAGSRYRLAELGLGEVRGFCYPYGRTSETSETFVREAGYEYACTTGKGVNSLRTDIYRLARINVRAETGILGLSFKLLRNVRYVQ